MIGEALVRVRRGAGVESEHRVAWATTDRGRGGRARGAGGAESAAYPGPTVYARSAAKPFQALAGVRAGVPEHFGLATEHLAMACASHGGSDLHVERVREILSAAGPSGAAAATTVGRRPGDTVLALDARTPADANERLSDHEARTW